MRVFIGQDGCRARGKIYFGLHCNDAEGRIKRLPVTKRLVSIYGIVVMVMARCVFCGKSAGSGGVKCLAELMVRWRGIFALIFGRALVLHVFMCGFRVRSLVKSAEGTCVGAVILVHNFILSS